MAEHAPKRWRIALAAVLSGSAVLFGTALPAPAGAQDGTSDDAAETAPTPPSEGGATGDPTPETSTAPAESPAAESPAAPSADEADPVPETSSAPADPSATPTDATQAGSASSELASPADATSDDGEPDVSPEAAGEDAAVTDEAATDEAAGEESGEAEAEEEAPPARGPQFTFANSFFSWTNAVTTNTFAPGAQLSYDPTWLMYFYLTPRFYLTDSTFLWLNQGITLEVTDTNNYTHNREPFLSDTFLDLRQLLRWEGFVFMGQARLVFPTSKASQATNMIMMTGLGLTVTRPFPELASFTVSGQLGYYRYWRTSNVVHADQPIYPFCPQVVGNPPAICSQAGGQTAARDYILAGLTMTVMPLPGLTVSLSGYYLALYGYEIADAQVPINGGNTTVTDTSPTHWRPYTSFALAVAYDVLPWLNLQLGIQNSGFAEPLYNPDGSVRSPFNTDTQVFLSTTMSLDGIYDQLFGVHGEEEELTPQERQRRRQGLASNGSSSTF